jgi:5'(3')-deoxyribonucleotidase
MKGDFEILLDMDGVLVDFIRGCIEVHDLRTTTEELYKENPGCWDVLSILKMQAPAFWKPMDFEFWSKLEWLSDGPDIVKHLEERYGQEHITLWTSPSENYGCMDGKKRWVERHLPRHYKHNIVFGSKKHLGARRDTILVDDSDSNVAKFGARGGKVCKPPRMWNSDYANRHRVMESIQEQLDRIERIGPHASE